MSRTSLGVLIAATAALAALDGSPVAAQSTAATQPNGEPHCEGSGHPTIGALVGGVAGAVTGNAIAVQLGMFVGGELGARVGRKCQKQAAQAPYPALQAGYPPGAYPNSYGPNPYGPAAYYPQPAYAYPVAQAVVPAPNYTVRTYGVPPYGPVYVSGARPR